ncbi:hypothetical protein PsorP6_005134 [Peronosclerospora sorghi]|uniref:Uncharacterized protein n=1 Tax=Peronosclerospora sorghi TaxID=230839 RepID=A0ACC0W6W4_9STRA|nr:hypothetical protein PsorP6_005134 [Peronosclerospora sorghi]
MPGDIKQHALTALSSRKTDGKGLRVAIVHTKWNSEVVNSLVSAAKAELEIAGVTQSNVVTASVSGAYELPYAASRLIASQKLDAVICIGCLIKGETMHFEYICDAVSQGIMRVQLDTGVPVIFGVLAVLNEQQAKERAGLSDKSHNHGTEWAQTAVEMARLREATLSGGCPMRAHEHLPYHSLTNCPFFSISTWLHITTLGALGFVNPGETLRMAAATRIRDPLLYWASRRSITADVPERKPFVAACGHGAEKIVQEALELEEISASLLLYSAS